MTKPSHGLSAAVGLFILGTAAGQAAAPTTVEEIANYQGADRQAMLEEGAKKEGEIQLYTTGAQTDPILNAFMKKYPYIKIQAFRPGGGSDVTRRMLEEYKAGRYVVDCVFMNSGNLIPMREEGDLQAYQTPDFPKYKPQAIEKNRFWVIDKESYVSLGYNTKAYPDEAQLPKSYDDYLDPKWKGKFAVSNNDTLAHWIGATLLTLPNGEEFLRKMGKTQDVRVYSVSGRGLSNLVVSGEVGLSPTIYDGHMTESRNQGASVGWHPIGGVYANIGANALAKRAPHPHAAMLLIDFMQSVEGQQMYQKMGYQSARLDMQNKDSPKEVYYLAERPNYDEEFEKWTKLGRDIFGPAGKAPGGK
jgi:iron(III) transport system substrate-binding protein